MEESEKRRERLLKDEEYLKNIHTENFEKPKLLGLDSEGTQVLIVPDENNYRFCFVEKNRIDQFSRMAAFAPAKQTELIATLFGLDAFNEFVKGFSAEIKNEHIDLEGVKQKELDKKSLEIESAKKTIVENDKSIEELVKTENELADKMENKEHAWFVGFAPVEDPQIAVAVILEYSGSTGGRVAAPIARELMADWLGR